MDPFTQLKNNLRGLNEGSLRSDKPLRFGLGFLKVSELVQQVYCELRLHYMYSKGIEPEYKRRSIIRKLLELYFQVEKDIDKARTGRAYMRIPLTSIIQGVPIIGTPDMILFDHYIPLAILRVKKSNKLKIYPEDEVRGLIYGRLLEALGFNVIALKYIIVVVKDLKDILDILHEVVDSIVKEEYHVTPIPNVRIAIRVYNGKEAEELLSYLLSYWKILREPKPNPSKPKCSRCEYSSICPHSVHNI